MVTGSSAKYDCHPRRGAGRRGEVVALCALSALLVLALASLSPLPGEEYGLWWAEAQSDKKSFITTWKTTAAGETIAIVVEGKKIKVDWGDGSDPSSGSSKTYTHNYTTPGSYQVSISGNIHSMDLLSAYHHDTSAGNSDKLVSIDQWGRAKWKSMTYAFYGASNMVHNATDKPNLKGVKSMASMFKGAKAFNADISGWDVSSVTDMSRMFFDAKAFNADISGWDVSNVRKMDDMFRGADAFSQNMGGWYVALDRASHVQSDRTNAIVGSISAQNKFLDKQNPTYGIDTGGVLTDHGAGHTDRAFWIDGNVLKTGEALSEGTYRVNITASGDGLFGGGSHFHVVEVVIGSGVNPPEFSVGDFNMTATEGSPVTLHANATDPDGDTLTYLWAQASGWPRVELSGAETQTATFTAPLVKDDTTLIFIGSVSDGARGDVVVVTVLVKDTNYPPESVEPADRRVKEGSVTTLRGDATDPNGDTLTYSWVQTYGPTVTLSGADTQNATFTAPLVDGDELLVFQFTVDDGRGGSDYGNVVITVANNRAPSVDAGGDQTVESGSAVTLAGTASDPDAGAGDTLTYSWSQASGEPSVTLSGADTQNATFTAPSADAVLTFVLNVTDGMDSETDSVTVTVEHNDPPEPVEPAERRVKEGSVTTLRGVATDPDGDTLAYSWVQTYGPTVTLSGADTQNATFTAPLVDNDEYLIFRLTVDDGNGESDYVTAVIEVVNNRAPSVDAGGDQTVESGSAVTLAGTASDPDAGAGDTLTYSWSQVFGPSVTLSGADTQTATFTAPSADAVLTFVLNVTDGMDSETDSVTVTVTPPQNANQQQASPQISSQPKSQPAEGRPLEQVSCSDANISQLISSGAYNVIDNRDGHLDGSTIEGTSGDDLILASDAGNTIKSKKGKDCIIGGAGNDSIFGNQGSDTIYGGAGNDTIHGGAGNDTISCGTGDSDVADGGRGTDTATSDCEESKNM